MAFGVNHLGHFLLTNLLLERLRRCGPSRVVTVAALLHWLGRVDFRLLASRKDLVPDESAWSVFRAYCSSKLCNVLFTRELATRLEGSAVSCYSLHPGLPAAPLSGPAARRRGLSAVLSLQARWTVSWVAAWARGSSCGPWPGSSWPTPRAAPRPCCTAPCRRPSSRSAGATSPAARCSRPARQDETTPRPRSCGRLVRGWRDWPKDGWKARRWPGPGRAVSTSCHRHG